MLRTPANQNSASILNPNGTSFYASGTWTPTFEASSGGAPTYSVQEGFYIKVGSLCFLFGRVAISAVGTLSGNIRLGGLPFTSTYSGAGSTSYQGEGIGRVSNITAVTQLTWGNATTSVAYLPLYKDKAATALVNTDLTSSTQIRFSLVYVTP